MMEQRKAQNAWIEKTFRLVEAYHRNRGRERLTIAIDGMSAAGKTTLGVLLQEKYGGNLFHTDDYFLQPFQKSKERLAEPGGNVDYERLKKEIVDRLEDKQGFLHGVYDCHRQCIVKQVKVPYEKLNIIEGCYSAHPYLGDYADMYFFLEINEKEQRERIKTRNGEAMLERFVGEWIPKEYQYFDVFQIRKKCICLRTDVEG